MLSILDLFSFKQTIHQLDPIKHLYRLGNQCNTCKKKLSYGQSITICNCNMFTHQKCFIKKFQQIQKCDQRSKIICGQCKADVKIQYCSQINFRPKCSFKCVVTLSLIIGLILLFFLLIFQNGIVVKQINPLMLTVQLLGVVVLLVLAFLIIMSSLYEKENRILSLQKSKKKIVISAFDHIITQPQEETQNEFVFISKNRKQQQDTI